MCVFLWFHCPWHSSFSFFWNTLGTVPSRPQVFKGWIALSTGKWFIQWIALSNVWTTGAWWKVLQKANPPPPMNLKDLYFMSFHVKLQGKELLGRTILVLEKSLIFPKKFCMNHVLWSSVNKVIHNVVVNFFISGNCCFSFVSTSLAYITIPKNKSKTKITWDKKLATAYTLHKIFGWF